MESQRQRPRRALDEVERILVLRPGAIGDALLAVPALRSLRARFPAAHLTLATQPSVARLLEACGEVHRGQPFDDPSLAWVFGREAIPHPPPDILVAWLSATDELAQRAERVGVARVVVAPSRPRPDDNRHAARYLLGTLAPLVGMAALDARPLRVAARPSPDVLLHAGSGSPRKNWPAERFAALAEALLAAGRSVRLVAGEADEDAVAAVERALGGALPRLTVGLDELAAALAGSPAYVGNDSGVSHLAGLVGTATVVLFGPTPWKVWHPLGARVTVLAFESSPRDVLQALSHLASAGASAPEAGVSALASAGG